MIRHTRGDVITFQTQFFDVNDQVTTEPAVNVTIIFPSAVPAGNLLSHDPGQLKGKVTLPMTADANFLWSVAWDTSISDPGTVFWSIRSNPAAISEDGSFVLRGNIANQESP